MASKDPAFRDMFVDNGLYAVDRKGGCHQPIHVYIDVDTFNITLVTICMLTYLCDKSPVTIHKKANSILSCLWP